MDSTDGNKSLRTFTVVMGIFLFILAIIMLVNFPTEIDAQNTEDTQYTLNAR